MGVTAGRLYIQEIESLQRLEIQFVPKELALDRSIDMPGVKIVGKNIPEYDYTGGETTLSLELDFFAETEDRKDVITRCNWLQGLGYNDGPDTPPPRIQLIFGDMFKKDVWVLKSFNCRLSNFNKEKGYFAQQAYVTLTLGLDNTGQYGTNEVRNAYARSQRFFD